MRRKLDGILLDVDGTLVESNDAHASAWSEALTESGRDVSAVTIRPLIGMGGDKLLPRLGIDPESSEGRAVSKKRREIFMERHVPRLSTTRGARELVARLRREGLRLVIASSAGEDELDAMLRQVGLADLLDHTTSADDADRSKPDPDIVHAALEKACLSPQTALLLGDTPYDVEAASKAGVDTVGLLCGGWDADSLSGAIAIYEDPSDILSRFTASPFACAA